MIRESLTRLKIVNYTHWPGAKLLLFELGQEVWWYQVDPWHCGNHPQWSVKSDKSGFLRNIIFFHFLKPKQSFLLVFGGLNKFFWTPISFLNTKLMILGGHTSRISQFELWFCAFWGKMGYRNVLISRMLEVWNPQNQKFSGQKG